MFGGDFISLDGGEIVNEELKSARDQAAKEWIEKHFMNGMFDEEEIGDAVSHYKDGFNDCHSLLSAKIAEMENTAKHFQSLFVQECTWREQKVFECGKLQSELTTLRKENERLNQYEIAATKAGRPLEITGIGFINELNLKCAEITTLRKQVEKLVSVLRNTVNKFHRIYPSMTSFETAEAREALAALEQHAKGSK